MEHILNVATMQRIIDTVDAGLSKGLGKQVLGQMCVEAAVCYALGMLHSDDPGCVGSAVRVFKIRLNDSSWESDKSRAAGMRRLAVAQIGSNQIDQQKFVEIVVIKTVSILFADLMDSTGFPEEAAKCRAARDLSTALSVLYAARSASVVPVAAVSAAVSSASCAVEAALLGVLINAAEYAANAAKAADLACKTMSSDKYLIVSANIALQALIELKSPGCEFLYLCDK